MVLGTLAKLIGSKAAGPATKAGGGGGIERIDILSNQHQQKSDDDKKAAIAPATAAFLYYESILQDSIRGTVTFTDTGMYGQKKDQTAVEGLPIVGQEKVEIKVTDNNDNTLKMTLYVNAVTPLVEDAQKSIVQLDLASKEFIMNEKVRINTRFNGKISDHIKKILEETNYLATEKEIDIEETANEQNCIGNNKKPFYLINWLSRGAVPKDGSLGNTAGYFFWETLDKFYFKSIDSLMDTETNKPKRKYLYNETPDKDGANIPPQYDAKAVAYNVRSRVNIQKKLQMGAYSTRIIMFDPYNCKYEVVNPNAGNTPGAPQSAKGNEKNLKLAGDNLPVLNDEFNKTEEGQMDFSRTTYYVHDVGSLPSGSGEGEEQEQIEKSKKENYKPGVVLNQGIQRINQLFALETTITIPGDFSLHAGDAVYVDAPKLKDDKKTTVNEQTGGNYIIADVCHYISAKHTLTKLNLIRDSFGRKPIQRG